MTNLTYAVVGAAERLVAKYGLKEAGRRIGGLALDVDPQPSYANWPRRWSTAGWS